MFTRRLQTHTGSHTRREALALLGSTGLFGRLVLGADSRKPMRGVFIIMATPYTETKAIDWERLASQIGFLDRCGVHGMVWPQLVSEYTSLTKDERMRGMTVLAKAARGKRPALVLGVQGDNTEEALEYTRHAESLEPDALIAIPPTQAKSLDDFARYYRTLLRASNRPLFIQTIGGAKIEPTIEFIADLAREFPHFGYIKEEHPPVLERMQKLARQRPTIKAIFSGLGGRDMMYEMRLGFDGTMPGAHYADIYAQIWELYQAGQKEKARELFGRLLPLVNLNETIPRMRHYIMHKRGVFKTMVSRRPAPELTPEAIQEIEFHFAAIKPYLRV